MPPRPADEFERNLNSARNDCIESLGQLLEPCRQYLLLIANQDLNPKLTAKVAPSDLVQDTFLTARRAFRDFRGATEQELLAWLRQILVNHLLTAQRRHLESQKRAAHREFSLTRYLYDSSDTLASNKSSPSNHLMQGELKQLVESAIARLPDHYQQVIHLRHRQALSFADVARHLSTTPDAARQLWTRAIKQMQKELRADEVL
jgi:RNA polymerase sigma-70 factor (ECF subfamily)